MTQLLAKIPDTLKSALSTAAWTFLALFGATSLSWLQEVAKWASASGHTPLPGLSVLGYGIVSAAGAALSGLVAFVVRTAQAHNILPGTPPTFAAKPAVAGPAEA